MVWGCGLGDRFMVNTCYSCPKLYTRYARYWGILLFLSYTIHKIYQILRYFAILVLYYTQYIQGIDVSCNSCPYKICKVLRYLAILDLYYAHDIQGIEISWYSCPILHTRYTRYWDIWLILSYTPHKIYQILRYLAILVHSLHTRYTEYAEFKEFERRFKFKPRFKYGGST